MYAALRPPGERHGVRRLVPWLLAVLILAPSATIRGAEHQFDGLIDLRFVQSDADSVWLDRGLDKSRFSDADTLVLGRALVEYRGRWTKILEARVSLAAFDTVDNPIDLTEAYLLIQPLPRSAWRFRVKAGAFFPPVSLENTDVAWTSPYTLSTSAINTWIGEEFRTIGLEGDVTLLGRFRGSRHDFGLIAGLYQFNDPAGSLVSWRG